MEVRYLVYTGNKVGGNVTVRQEPRLSPNRTLKVYPGRRWEIGRQIPPLTAKRVIAQLSSLFQIEVLQVDDRKAIVQTLSELYEKYDQNIGVEGSKAVISYAVVEALCSAFGKDAIKPALQALKDAADGDDDQLEDIAQTFSDVMAAEEEPPSLTALKPGIPAIEETDESSDIDPSTETDPNDIDEDDDGDEDLGPDDDESESAESGKSKKKKKSKKKR